MFDDNCDTCKKNEELLARNPGPWSGEPNRVEFTHAGFLCILHRGNCGAWCGYVGLPPSHPAYGKGYDDVDVDVHGGLTYADHCQDHVCHQDLNDPNDKRYWLGFDCAHFMDLTPSEVDIAAKYALSPEPLGVYRNLAYARRETKRLAKRLAAMVK